MSFFGIPMRNGLSLGLGTVASLTNGPGFLPDELFYGSTVQGAWYDPSDLTTLFQDSAGTTPVTAVEQAVGLMLDKSKGLVLGSELVTNGDFSGGSTGWTVGTGWSVGSGVASHVAGAAGSLFQSMGLTPGKWYRITFTVSNYAGGSVDFRFGGGPSGGTSRTANGTYTTTELCPVGAAGTGVFFGDASFVGSIDNISVRELPGNHAYQSTSASRPTLRARYNLLTYSEQFDNAYWFKANSSISANVAVAPDGTTTGDKLVENTANNQHWVGGASTGVALVSGASYTVSVYAKQGERGYIRLYGDAGSGSLTTGAVFNLTNGTIFSTAVGATASITSVGNGWYRCVVTSTATGSTNLYPYVGLRQDSNPSADSYIGDGTSGAFIWGLQAVPTAVFPSNTYQRIGAATDYATGAAFPPYLFFDGIDDCMLTNSVDFATVTSDGQARRNLLNNPTQFDVAASWTPTALTVTANTVAAPDGTITADTITGDGTVSTHWITQSQSASATGKVFSIYAKAGTNNFIQLLFAGDASPWANFDLSNGTVGSVGASVTAAISDAGNGWYRCSASTSSASASSVFVNLVNAATAPRGQSVALSTTVHLWGAQAESGTILTAFQNIGTDKMLVVAGVTKNSDAAQAHLLELSSDSGANNGSFLVAAPRTSAPNYRFFSRGTGNADAFPSSGYTAPITNIVTGIGDIATDVCILRVNGTQAATSTADQGTGNYGSYPLYIGRRNNASLPFNGNLYSLIIAGQSYSSGQISSTESWVAAKTPLGTI